MKRALKPLLIEDLKVGLHITDKNGIPYVILKIEYEACTGLPRLFVQQKPTQFLQFLTTKKWIWYIEDLYVYYCDEAKRYCNTDHLVNYNSKYKIDSKYSCTKCKLKRFEERMLKSKEESENENNDL